MAGKADTDRYATPNRTTTVAPAPRQVRFLYWNYFTVDNLDELVKGDSWLQVPGKIVRGFFKALLDQIFVNPLLAWMDIGRDSRKIQPVGDQRIDAACCDTLSADHVFRSPATETRTNMSSGTEIRIWQRRNTK